MVSNPEPIKEPIEEQIEKRADEIAEKMSFTDITEMAIEELGMTEEIGAAIELYYWPTIIEHIENKLRRGEIE